MKSLILLASIFFLTGCASVPKQQIYNMPITTSETKAMPTRPLITSPSFSTPTKESSITPTNSPTPLANFPSPTPDAKIDKALLDSISSAWNTHDASIVRPLYTEKARYFTTEEMHKLYNGEAVDVLVSDVGFLDHVQKYEGYKIHMLGEPIGIYGKLIAFAYRWENENKSGYNAVALLRYENDRILLHIDVVSQNLTSEGESNAGYWSNNEIDNLFKAWNDAELSAASKLYSDQAIILSDEDLAQTPWRDYSVPPQLNRLLAQFAGWNPVLLGEPFRIDDMVIFAWHWERKNLDYPIGYGLRLLQYEDSSIVTDVRFAIRPWEEQGNNFLNP